MRCIVWIVAGTLLGMVVGLTPWLAEDPWAVLCQESARDLPKVIPKRLIVIVMDEHWERLVDGILLAVKAGLV